MSLTSGSVSMQKSAMETTMTMTEMMANMRANSDESGYSKSIHMRRLWRMDGSSLAAASLSMR